MIISYPYLPERAAADSEKDYRAKVDAYLRGHGGYPACYDMRWHGGIHLYAETSIPSPVRAIADGEVVAYRRAAKATVYKPGAGQEDQECDNSFVLLKHETETGDGIKVAYYSLYMHLMNEADRKKAKGAAAIVEAVRTDTGTGIVKPSPGAKVWRKDVLGHAGVMYRKKDSPGSGFGFFHFEIFTTDEALKAFWRDSRVDVEQADKDGGKEYFGSSYYIVPAKTEFKDKHPQAGKDNAKKPNEVKGIEFAPQTVGSNEKKLYVETYYERGERYTIVWEAQDDGTAKRITGEDGVKHPADKYEYSLYDRACKLYPKCPSAGYELLRFGRILGPDTLPADEQANWQPVPFAEGKVGYVDLSDSTIRKLSDADFPHWKGWQKIEETSGAFTEDAICDALQLQKLLKEADADRDGAVSEGEWSAFASGKGKDILRRTVCRFPTEWDGSDNETRFKRLKEKDQPFHEKPEAYQAFIDHLKDLQFWNETGLPVSVWHFHPLEFIRHFRKCGWLSSNELARCVRASTKESKNETGKLSPSEILNRIKNSGEKRPENLYPNISSMLRRYGITSSIRQAHFFGQIFQETGRLELMVEGGADDYFDKYEPGTDQGRKLGNTQAGDGLRFKGRGLIQLTGRTNYANYGKYRDKNYLSDDSAGLLASRPYETVDTGGYYWISKQRYTEKNKKLVPLGLQSINSWADKGAKDSDQKEVTRCVNPGLNHYEFRHQYFEHAYFVLNDSAIVPDNFKPLPL